MPTPHYRLSTVSRGSTRFGETRRATRSGGSAAGRLEYIERGGPYRTRSDEVLGVGIAGPDLGDWVGVDRTEIRRDAIVARELVATIPYTLSWAAQMRLAQDHADDLRREFGVAIRWALHQASGKPGSDSRNVHAHFLLTTRTISDEGQPGRKTKILDNSATAGKAVAFMRGKWQDQVNRALIAARLHERLDLRSYKARGLSIQAQARVPRFEFELARLGRIHSPTYEHNQALLSLRNAAAAITNAVAKFARTRRIVAIGAVLRGRSSRTDRRRGARRVMDFTRSAACAQSSGFSGNRGGRFHYRRTEGGGDGRENQMVVAGTESDRQWQANYTPKLDVRGIARLHRSGTQGTTSTTAVDRHQGTAEHSPITPIVGPTTPSLIGKVTRWFSGADRRSDPSVEAQSPQTETVQVKGKQPNTVESSGHIKKKLSAGDAGTNVEQIEQMETSKITPDEHCEDVAESMLTLIRVETRTGGTFYIHHVDWLAACAQGAVNVPTCDCRGLGVQAGEKTALRRSTIEGSDLTPVAIDSAEMYILQPELIQDQGLSMER